ncbi:MAG TPA: ribonuclease H [Gemmatimonadaceae bacterium]|nr:ribonuclease H [Gemmatimonadaceae bacterium]
MNGPESPNRERTGGPLPLIAIYADESCLGNGREGSNPGGAAGVIEYWNPAAERLTRCDYWTAEPATTNNRMALRSLIEGFEIISRKGGRFRVVFTSDSQYLVKGMSEWLHGWIARGWRRKQGEIENLAMWRAAAAAVCGHAVEWRWVRGHEGHPQNEYANDLAVRAAREQTSSGGAVPTGFDAWLATMRERGRVTSEPDPFPLDRPFRPARPLPFVTKGSFTS